MRISIGQRIAIGLLLVIGLIATLIVVNGATVSSYRDNALLLATETFPRSRLIHELETGSDQILAETLHFVIEGDDKHVQSHASTVASVQETLAQLREAGERDRIGLETERSRVDALLAAVSDTIAFTNGVIARRQQGEALDLTQIAEQFDEREEQTIAAIDAFEVVLEEESKQVAAAAQTDPLIATQVVGILVLLVSIGLFVILVRTVVMPLRILRDATLAVAAGDLDRQVRVARQDEIGDLAAAFNQMVVRVAEQQQVLQVEVEQANAARGVAEAARSAIAAQLATIEEQRGVIRNLSVPILPLSTTALVLPLVGELDADRLRQIQEQALHALESSSAHHLILDITGVPMVDTAVAQGVIQIIQAARLLGTEVVLAGIRPEVAQAVVGLGVDLSKMVSRSTLQSGINYVLKNSGRGPRD